MNEDSTKVSSHARTTHPVSDGLFRQVYDSPASLPGKHRWVTTDEDVRAMEKLLGVPQRTIGEPLWVNGDPRQCPTGGRETNGLAIVRSALAGVQQRAMLVRVITGEQKYVNTEVPRAVADPSCHQWGTPIEDLRSFKCHNWAYAIGDLQKVIEQLHRQRQPSEE